MIWLMASPVLVFLLTVVQIAVSSWMCVATATLAITKARAYQPATLKASFAHVLKDTREADAKETLMSAKPPLAEMVVRVQIHQATTHVYVGLAGRGLRARYATGRTAWCALE